MLRTEMVLVSSKIKETKLEGAHPIMVAEGSIGALINTSDAVCPGLAVVFDLRDGFTEEDFDQILSTFRFTQ